MTIREAKDIAKEWVLKEAVKIEGFDGAFYHGSINWLSDGDLLPLASDLDILIVLKASSSLPPSPGSLTQPSDPAGKFIYRDLLLDVSFISREDLSSPEQILSTYYLAGDFAKPTFIADPSGRLADLQREVAGKYATAFWVNRRCLGARDNVLRFMDRLKETDLLHNQVTNWLFARGVMTHILLVAGLKNPTVRKRYVDAQKLLAQHDALEFYEQLLELSGFHQLTRQQAEVHLASLTGIYDLACTFRRTPYQFGADISKMARPVVIGGSQELIQTGFHREAMFWIIATHCRCQQVFYQDASPELRQQANAVFRQILSDLHIADYKDRLNSNEKARHFLPVVWRMAQTILLNHVL